jgi:hypothetical protein
MARGVSRVSPQERRVPPSHRAIEVEALLLHNEHGSVGRSAQFSRNVCGAVFGLR